MKVVKRLNKRFCERCEKVEDDERTVLLIIAIFEGKFDKLTEVL